MKKHALENYLSLLKQLVDLQRRLFHRFEVTVKIRPISSKLANVVEGGDQISQIINPKHTVSKILRDWPVEVPWITMIIWAYPRVGVMEFEEGAWLFIMHGTMEVRFAKLSSELDRSTLRSLKNGNLEVLQNVSMLETVVEAEYDADGRIDGITEQSAYEFATSTGSEFAELSEEDHRKRLEELVEPGFLRRSSHFSGLFFLTGQ